MSKKISLAFILSFVIAGAGSAFAQTGSSTVAPPRPVRKRAPPKAVEPPAARPPTELPPDAPLDKVLEGKDKTGTPPKPPEVEILGAQTSSAGDDRPMPDYDNRDDEPTTAGEALIWVPRILFFPVHLVFEYLLRWPLVNGLALAEEVKLFKRINDFFTWRDGKSGVFPTFFADFGLKPAVGLSTFHREFPTKNNDFSAALGWWYPNWWNAKLLNRTTVLSDDTGAIDVYGSFVARPDSPFWGIGANSNGRINPPYRFDKREAEGGLAFIAGLSGLSRFKISAGYRWTDFEDEPAVPDMPGGDGARPLLRDPDPILCGIDPVRGVTGLVDPRFAGGCGPIPGFNFGVPLGSDGLGRFHLIDTRIELKLDTRDPDTQFKGGTGFLLEVFGGFTFSPFETALNYFRYGGEIAGFYDFTDIGHVIALRLRTELLVRSGTDLRAGGNSEVPFTELPSLGGLDTMRGYLAGRFLGDSTLEATLSYRYPVWSLIDAEIFLGVGNAFEGHYGIGDPGENFSFERLYFDAGLGVRTSLKRDTGLQILIAFGTNRFDGGDGDGPQGLELDSVRFVFGLAEGF